RRNRLGWWRATETRRRITERLFLSADNFQRCKQPHARGARRNLWPGLFGNHLRQRRRIDSTSQRDDVRTVRRHLDARPHARSSFRPRGEGRRRLDQYLQYVQCRVAVRRIQAIWLWPGDGEARARTLHASEKRLGRSFRQADWLVWK